MTSRVRQLGVMAMAICICALLLNTSSANAATTLKQGVRGGQVIELQQQLRQLGYLKVNPTGYFGPLTTVAVQKLQRDHYLKPDGIVGPQTRSLINKLAPKFGGNKEVLGFHVGDEPGIPSSFTTLQNQKDTITSVSPFWYRLDQQKPGQLELFGVQSTREIDQVIRYSQNNSIKNYALVHNLLYGKSSLSKDILHNNLSDPKKRWNLVMNIHNLLKTKGFDGVCIDIENMHAWDRALFVQFLKELSSQLKPAGYDILVCVPSKTSDKKNGGWGDNFDYAKVGQYADRVVIMAYDEHTSGSPPGPIASKVYVEKVIKYSLTKLPPEKILLGVAGFGFDWNVRQGTSRYISHAMAMNTAKQYNRAIQWDNTHQVPYFKYTDKNGSWHNVYFENASSLAAKLDLVNKYDLKGIAIWRLGMEDPASWKVTRDKLAI